MRVAERIEHSLHRAFIQFARVRFVDIIGYEELIDALQKLGIALGIVRGADGGLSPSFGHRYGKGGHNKSEDRNNTPDGRRAARTAGRKFHG